VKAFLEFFFPVTEIEAFKELFHAKNIALLWPTQLLTCTENKQVQNK